jgi:putative glutamine amidotransferase
VTKHAATANSDPESPSALLVGVTATTSTDGNVERARLNTAYVRAIASVGLIPVVLPPLDAGTAGDVLSRLDGLVLSGGEDVDPELFGETRHPKLGRVNAERDRWELALTDVSRARRMPLLAICRGVQVLNVAFKGTLFQDIPSELNHAIDHDSSSGDRSSLTHEVGIEDDSRLAAAVDATTIMCNSIHHQAIRVLGPGLRAVARSEDGLVEAAEPVDDAWWAVGVQWHPEELLGSSEPSHRRLFESFADAVRRHRQGITG